MLHVQSFSFLDTSHLADHLPGKVVEFKVGWGNVRIQKKKSGKGVNWGHSVDVLAVLLSHEVEIFGVIFLNKPVHVVVLN